MKPPTKPADTRLHVYRGGSWSVDVPSWVRPASRDSYDPAYRYRGGNIGFRTHLAGRQPRV